MAIHTHAHTYADPHAHTSNAAHGAAYCEHAAADVESTLARLPSLCLGLPQHALTAWLTSSLLRASAEHTTWCSSGNAWLHAACVWREAWGNATRGNSARRCMPRCTRLCPGLLNAKEGRKREQENLDTRRVHRWHNLETHLCIPTSHAVQNPDNRPPDSVCIQNLPAGGNFSLAPHTKPKFLLRLYCRTLEAHYIVARALLATGVLTTYPTT